MMLMMTVLNKLGLVCLCLCVFVAPIQGKLTFTFSCFQAEFQRLALGFKCDMFTLEKRLRLEERSRDLAEENVRREVSSCQGLLQVCVCLFLCICVWTLFNNLLIFVVSSCRLFKCLNLTVKCVSNYSMCGLRCNDFSSFSFFFISLFHSSSPFLPGSDSSVWGWQPIYGDHPEAPEEPRYPYPIHGQGI